MADEEIDSLLFEMGYDPTTIEFIEFDDFRRAIEGHIDDYLLEIKSLQNMYLDIEDRKKNYHFKFYKTEKGLVGYIQTGRKQAGFKTP